MTILQLRGTSGSGKSTVMRQIVESICPLDKWKKHYTEGRRQPETYRHKGFYITGLRSWVVCGHYEVDGGGCDNVGSAAKVYDLYQKILKEYKDKQDPIILSEGLLLSEDYKWTHQLGDDVIVIYLTTPVEECIRRVKSRRKKAGNTKPLNEQNTRRRVDVIWRSRVKLIEAGIKCYRCSDKQAVKLVLSLVGRST